MIWTIENYSGDGTGLEMALSSVGSYATTIYESAFEIEYALPQSGELGFSFAGGTDRPIQPGDPSLYVTNIDSSGPASGAFRDVT